MSSHRSRLPRLLACSAVLVSLFLNACSGGTTNVPPIPTGIASQAGATRILAQTPAQREACVASPKFSPKACLSPTVPTAGLPGSPIRSPHPQDFTQQGMPGWYCGDVGGSDWNCTFFGSGDGGWGEGQNPCDMGQCDPLVNGRFYCDPQTFMCGQNIVAYGATCTGGLAKNTSANGNGDHNDMISNESGWIAGIPGGGSSLVAIEYQTYGGKEYLQPLYQVGVSAGVGVVGASITPTGYVMLPFNGNIVSTLTQFAGILGKIGKAVPSWLTHLPTASLSRLPCNPNTIING